MTLAHGLQKYEEMFTFADSMCNRGTSSSNLDRTKSTTFLRSMELEENDGFEQEKMISRRRSMSAAVMASSDCINLLDDNNNNNTRVGSFRKQEITSASRQNALVSAEKLDMLTSAANLDIRLAHPISSQSSDVLMGTFEQLLEEYTRHHGSSVSINRSVKYEEGSLLEKFRDFALKLEFFIKQKENEIHTLKSAYNATRNDLTFHELSKSSAEFGVFEFKERIRAQRDAILSLRKDTVEKESTILQLEIQNQELKGQIGALQSALEYKDLYIMSLENKQLQEEQYEAAIASPVKSPLKKALLDPSLCEDDEVSLSRPRSPSRGSTFQLDFQNSNIFASEISSPAKTLHRKQSIASATSTVESVLAEEYEEITELVSSPTIEEEPQSVLVLHFGHSHLLCGLYTDGSNPNRSVSGFSNRSDITLVKIPLCSYASLKKSTTGENSEIDMDDHGLPLSFRLMEELFDSAFAQLDVNESIHNVVVAHEPLLLLAMEARESLTKLLLGTFNVRGLNLTTSAQMILKGRGQSSGLVIEIHENSLCIVPVIEELVLQHAIVTMPSLSERRIIERVRKLLLLSHETIGTYEKLGKNLQLQIAKDMLIQFGIIFPQHDAPNEISTQFMLKSKKILERGYRYDFPEDDIHESVLSSLEPFYEAPEVFFHRSKASTSLSKELTLAEGLLETILACNPLIHQELVSNILLVGDLASIPGFGIRLQNELEVLFQTEGLKSLWKDVKVQILEHELYGYKGCCQHAEKIPSTMWITEEDYLVHGSDVLRKKCY